MKKSFFMTKLAESFASCSSPTKISAANKDKVALVNNIYIYPSLKVFHSTEE